MTNLCMVAVCLRLPVAQHVLHSCHVVGDHAAHVVHQPTDLHTRVAQGRRQPQQSQRTAAAAGPLQNVWSILWELPPC
jgi:hypothetical protein